MSAVNFYRTRYGMMVHYASDRCIRASLQEYGEWGEHEIHYLRPYVKKKGVVIDVGANVGTHTLAFGDIVGDEGFVIAIEAQPEIFLLLSSNIVLNGLQDRVIALNVLAGSKQGATIYSASPDKAVDNFGAESFALENTAAHNRRSAETKLSTVRLDDLGVTSCDLLKIDVEGMEWEVLQGATSLLHTARPAIYFEANTEHNFAEIVRLLREFGYRLFWHVSNPFNVDNFNGSPVNIFGGSTETNVLCVGPGGHVPDDLVEVIDVEYNPPHKALAETALGTRVPVNEAAAPSLPFVPLETFRQLEQRLVAILADRSKAQEVIEQQHATLQDIRSILS